MEDLGQVYRKLTTAEKARHVLGQIFWIPAYLHMQDYYVVRVGHPLPFPRARDKRSMLSRQIAAQEKAFVEEGGFTERLHRLRSRAQLASG